MICTSRKVDEQVVRMSFDNNKFNSNIKDTENSLDSLDKKLNTVGKNDSLNKMSNDMSSCATSFSKSSVIIQGALIKIGYEIVNLGKKLANSITKGVREGFSEYNLQIESTQTILSNVSDEGKGIKEVTAALDELNRYADKTIYNFSQMTRNIGMFTAAGTNLDTSVSTIKGLANAAAVVGASSSTASRAWYQVSQAMAAGTFKLMDWRSLEISNIAGEKFQDVIKEVARATNAVDKHGRNIDQMIKKYGSLRDSLKEGWLTAERFSEAMTILSGDWDESDLKAKGYTDKQIKKLRKIADEATEAATAVRTLSTLVSTVAETIGSGWAESWRIIVGDFEEAKSLFTGINNILSDFISKGQIIRKALLEKIFTEDKGREKLKNVFDNTLTSFSALYRAFRAGWKNIFSVERIRNAASKVIDFMEKTSEALVLNEKNQLKDVYQYGQLEDPSSKVAAQYKNIEKTSQWNHDAITKAIENVMRIARGAASALDIVWSVVKQVADFVFSRIPFFKNFYNNLKKGNEGLLQSLANVADVITTIRNIVVNEKIVTKLLEFIENKIKEIVANSPALQMLVSLIKWIAGNIKIAFSNIKKVDFSGVKKVIDDLAIVLSKIFGVIFSEDTFQTMADIFGMILGLGKGILEGFGSFLSGFVESIDKTDVRTKQFLSTIAKVTVAFVLLKNLITKIPNLAYFLYKLNIPQLFKYLTKYMKAKALRETSESIRNVAVSVGILSASLIALSIVPFETLVERLTLAGMGILMFVLAVKSISGAISMVDDLKSAVIGVVRNFAVASIFATIAISILSLVAALSLLKLVFPDPDLLGKYISQITKLFLALAASVIVVSKAFNVFGTTLASILKVVGIKIAISSLTKSMLLMAVVIAILSMIPEESMARAVAAIGYISIIFMGMFSLFSMVNGLEGKVFGLLIILGALNSVVGALSLCIGTLSLIPEERVAAATVAVTTSMMAMVVLFTAVALLSSHFGDIKVALGVSMLLSGLVNMLKGLMYEIAIIAKIFSESKIEFKQIAMVAASLGIAVAAIAIAIAGMVKLTNIFNNNVVSFSLFIETSFILITATNIILNIAKAITNVAITLNNVSWNTIAKTGAVFVASILIFVGIIKSFSFLYKSIMTLGEFAALSALSLLAFQIALMISAIAAAMAAVAKSLTDVSWLDLIKVSALFIAASTIFLGVIEGLVLIAKSISKNWVTVVGFLALSASINAFLISMGISFALAASAIHNLSNVNISSNTISILSMYMVIIGVFVAIAALFSKLPAKVTFNFLSLSAALVLISIFAETLARVINGMLKYSEEMPEMGAKIGEAIGNFCLGVADTLIFSIPAIMKSIFSILYMIATSLKENAPIIADTIANAITAVIEIAFRLATMRITLSNGLNINLGFVFKLFGINWIVKLLTGKGMIAILAGAVGKLIKTTLVTSMASSGATAATTWGSMFGMLLNKLGIFGKGVETVNGQINLSFKNLANAAWSIGAITLAVIATKASLTSISNAWKIYTGEMESYNNAYYNSTSKILSNLTSDGQLFSQVLSDGFFNLGYKLSAWPAMMKSAWYSMFYEITYKIKELTNNVRAFGYEIQKMPIEIEKAFNNANPLYSEDYKKLMNKYYDQQLLALSEQQAAAKLDGLEDLLHKVEEAMKGANDAWNYFWKDTGDDTHKGEWGYNGKNEEAGKKDAKSYAAGYKKEYGNFTDDAINDMYKFLGIKSKSSEEFNYEEYKEQNGFYAALTKIAERSRDSLIGLSKEEAIEVLKNKIYEYTKNETQAKDAAKAIISAAMDRSNEEGKITAKTTAYIVSKEAEAAKDVADIKDNSNKLAAEQANERFRIEKEISYNISRLKVLEAKGVTNLNTAELKEYETLTNRNKELKVQYNNISKVSSAYDYINNLWNKWKASSIDTSLFNSEELEKYLEQIRGGKTEDNKKKKDPNVKTGLEKTKEKLKETKNQAKSIKNDLEKNRADLTPIIDLDRLSDEANKAGDIVTSSLLAAQNAAIGDYINTNSELNPFLKDRWQNVYNFTQNNYSPKALSRIDIYRQTQRQLSMSRGF